MLVFIVFLWYNIDVVGNPTIINYQKEAYL